MSRIDDATRHRDVALSIIRKHGKIERGEVPHTSARVGAFSFALFTPFQPNPDLGNAPGYYRALLGMDVPKSYQLDAWYDGKKVLSVDWEEGERASVLSLRRGEWEGLLANLDCSLHDAAVGE
jgi:hypothetical protein